jgi:HEAT repeat protein
LTALLIIGFVLGLLSLGGLTLVLMVNAGRGQTQPQVRVDNGSVQRLSVLDDAAALQLERVAEGVWRKAGDLSRAPVELHGLGEPLPHTAYRLVVDGGWAVSLRTGQPGLDAATGDEAFDAVVSVRQGVSFVDAAVRAAVLSRSEAHLLLKDGVITVALDGANLLEQWSRVEAVRDALDAAEGADDALALRDPCPGVRAQALARVADPALSRQLLDNDPSSAVQLVAAQHLKDLDALARIVSDPGATGDVRWRALSALPAERVHALIEVLIVSDVPSLWWGLVRLDTLQGVERSEALRRLVRPGALDPLAWPVHPRVAHVGARVAMALGENPTHDAEAVLLELLRAPEDRVVAASARALGQIGTLQGLPPLRALIEGGSRPIRIAARDAAAALVTRLGARAR